MEIINTKQPQQNVIYFTCFDQSHKQFKIRFNSIFDSGNLLDIKQENTFTVPSSHPLTPLVHHQHCTRLHGDRIRILHPKLVLFRSEGHPSRQPNQFHHEENPYTLLHGKGIISPSFASTKLRQTSTALCIDMRMVLGKECLKNAS
jgi:hypothetical protein